MSDIPLEAETHLVGWVLKDLTDGQQISVRAGYLRALLSALAAARTENGRLTLDIVALRQGHDRLSAALAEANRKIAAREAQITETLDRELDDIAAPSEFHCDICGSDTHDALGHSNPTEQESTP